MLKWKVKDGLISELFSDKGDNFILPWGVETADEWSFFSLERPVGYRYTRLHETIVSSDNLNQVKLEALMRQGHFKLELNEFLNESDILRELHLETLAQTRLMDFVLRFRFKKELFPLASIAGQTFEHNNTNIYHQFETREATLKGPQGEIKIRVEDVFCPPSFIPHLYVRDRGDEWIVHARLLPASWDRETIKLCNSFFKTSPLPQFLSRLFLAIPAVRKALWYRGERAPFKGKILRWLNPNAFAFCTLPRGEKLSWKVRMSWYKIGA